MKTAVYPGSFNPWHKGHLDILHKALKVFDRVIVLRYHQCPNTYPALQTVPGMRLSKLLNLSVGVEQFNGLLVDWIKKNRGICAIIRGIRNGSDLQYEQNMQYWNEDLGLKIPIVYFVTDRKLAHISSSTIREIECIKRKK